MYSTLNDGKRAKAGSKEKNNKEGIYVLIRIDLSHIF
jgi:hypothetical protein